MFGKTNNGNHTIILFIHRSGLYWLMRADARRPGQEFLVYSVAILVQVVNGSSFSSLQMEIPPSSEWVQSWHTNEAGLDALETEAVREVGMTQHSLLLPRKTEELDSRATE